MNLRFSRPGNCQITPLTTTTTTNNNNYNSLASPMSSWSVIETVNGSHKFVIQDYSLAKGMGVGQHIASETFTIGGHQWEIYFYPDGKNLENSSFVSVFIALVSGGTDVRALFELTLVDQSGKGKHMVHSHFYRYRSLEGAPYTLKCIGSMWGYKRFYGRAGLETSDFLKDDCLRINCAVGVVVSAVDFSSLHSIPVPESDSGADFGFMLEHDETADVVFDVSGEKFHAHKLVLTARSSVFEAEFFEGNENDSNEIVVKDMEPKVFKALLHFIYKDNLTVEDELMSTSSPMPSACDTLAGKLLAAADKYGLARLRLMCEFLLCKDISVNSVARILDLAESYQAMDLKAVCLKFAAENLEAVMRSDGFAYLKENCPFLQSELLKSIAGCEEECSGGGKSQSVLAQFSDGDNITGKTWECGNGEGSRSLWVKLLDGGDTKVGSSRQHP